MNMQITHSHLTLVLGFSPNVTLEKLPLTIACCFLAWQWPVYFPSTHHILCVWFICLTLLVPVAAGGCILREHRAVADWSMSTFTSSVVAGRSKSPSNEWNKVVLLHTHKLHSYTLNRPLRTIWYVNFSDVWICLRHGVYDSIPCYVIGTRMDQNCISYMV